MTTSTVRFFVYIDQAAAIRAGSSRWGLQPLDLDLEQLTPDERAILADYAVDVYDHPRRGMVRKNEAPVGDLGGLAPVGIALTSHHLYQLPAVSAPTVEAVRGGIAAIAEAVRLEAERKANAEANAARERAEAEAELQARAVQVINALRAAKDGAPLVLEDGVTIDVAAYASGPCFAFKGSPTAPTYYFLNTENMAADHPLRAELVRLAAEYTDAVKAKRKAEAEAQAARRKAEEDELAAARERTTREVVARLGSEDQLERLNAGVLPMREVRELLERDAFGDIPLEEYERIKAEDLAHQDDYGEHDITVRSEEVTTYSAAQWVAIKRVRLCLTNDYDGCKVMRHRATCDRDDCDAELVRYAIHVRAERKGFEPLVKRFVCPE